MTVGPEGTVVVEIDDKIARIRLVGGDDSNSLSDSMLVSLATLLNELEENDDVWVVTIRGNNGALGADPDQDRPSEPPNPVASGGELARAVLRSRTASPGADPFAVLRHFPKPIIGALEGHVTGRALAIALCCDLRIAAPTMLASCREVLDGRLPHHALTQLLPRLIGVSHATDLLLTGRQIDAEEAVAVGLANRIAATDEINPDLEKLIATLRGSAPLALRFAKEAVVAGSELPLEAGVTLELDLSLILQLSHDRAEGLNAFHAKRPPRYEGR